MIDTVPPGGHYSDTRIALGADGGYDMTIGTAEFGNGTTTVHQQIAATVLSDQAGECPPPAVRQRSRRSRHRRLRFNRHGDCRTRHATGGRSDARQAAGLRRRLRQGQTRGLHAFGRRGDLRHAAYPVERTACRRGKPRRSSLPRTAPPTAAALGRLQRARFPRGGASGQRRNPHPQERAGRRRRHRDQSDAMPRAGRRRRGAGAGRGAVRGGRGRRQRPRHDAELPRLITYPPSPTCRAPKCCSPTPAIRWGRSARNR